MELSLGLFFLVQIIKSRDNSTGFTIVWGKVYGNISSKPSANFSRSINVLIALVSKGEYLDNAYACNINSINNNSISVFGYELGTGNINYVVYGFS